MDFRTFGRTGLRVSAAGIGSGGASRLGLLTGSTEDEAIAVLRRALELGVNYYDTAEGYGTEGVIGRAFEGHRDDVIISSKISPRLADGSFRDRAGLRLALDEALAKLRTDHVDVYHLHRPGVEDYDYCLNELVPELISLRDAGKMRFLGISGSTSPDPTHPMLHRAVQDDCWDVVMVAFNLLNQAARRQVFAYTIPNDVAVEIMSAATGPFSHPAELTDEINRLLDAGTLERGNVDAGNLLGFLDGVGGVDALAGASYRFASNEPGVNVVLVGTGNLAHLEENIGSINAGPLPDAVRDQMVSLFGHLAAQRPAREQPAPA